MHLATKIAMAHWCLFTDNVVYEVLIKLGVFSIYIYYFSLGIM